MLPVVSKIFEKHVAKSLMRLMTYLEQNKLLYKCQSAFRDGTALIKLTDEILSNMDKDNVTGVVFVDFKKAFDVVNDQLLLKKLELYRVSNKALRTLF